MSIRTKILRAQQAASRKRQTVTVKAIIKAIGSDKLELVRGNGYWYFVYDDKAKNRFKTMSVYVVILRQLPLDQWVAEGREFVTEMESK